MGDFTIVRQFVDREAREGNDTSGRAPRLTAGSRLGTTTSRVAGEQGNIAADATPTLALCPSFDYHH